ncbi:response regulator [Candidatus Uhrbacteria bacterium]|nr:response regulator [Candidatus Uhrbacteria bacterium]
MKTSVKRILVVEDDDFILRAYTAGLEHAGYEVMTVTNGEDGLKQMRAWHPDLVLLDLIMPIKDGFETLEEKHKDPALKKIPTLILSNLGQDDDIARGLALGAKEYFIKANYSLPDVVKKIQDTLDT